MIRKYRIAISIITVILVIVGIFYYKLHYDDHGLLYSREYIAGSGNIKGNVDTKHFYNLSTDFEIGVNRYGYAVFKKPDVALTRLISDYRTGIDLIKKEYNLAPLSQNNFENYKKCGCQVTTGTKEEKEQAKFISGFFDIYENSFRLQ